jgi:hypothetical protein
VSAALVVLVMLCFDLSGIAMMGRAVFLLVYAAVNAGHLLVLNQTETNATIVWLSLRANWDAGGTRDLVSRRSISLSY